MCLLAVVVVEVAVVVVEVGLAVQELLASTGRPMAAAAAAVTVGSQEAPLLPMR